MKDSDIASKIAREAGFMETDISDTSTTHRHVSQISQTDWDFLRGRAQEIGFEVGVVAGQVLLPRGVERQAERWRLGAMAPSPARRRAWPAVGRRR